MRPIPIDGDAVQRIVERAGAPEHRMVVMSAPNGDLLDDDIRPVEALVYESELGTYYAMVVVLEDGDLDKLQSNGGKILVTMVSGVVPYDVEVL